MTTDDIKPTEKFKLGKLLYYYDRGKIKRLYVLGLDSHNKPPNKQRNYTIDVFDPSSIILIGEFERDGVDELTETGHWYIEE